MIQLAEGALLCSVLFCSAFSGLKSCVLQYARYTSDLIDQSSLTEEEKKMLYSVLVIFLR
jgi:hypothetical protein